MDQYLGEIRLVAFNYAPQGWALCNGQIMAIAQFNALFALLGTIYGGDGRTTFALPNLQSRIAVGQGQGLGLSTYNIGQVGGAENVSLTAGNLPAHAHQFAQQTSTQVGNQGSPSGSILATALDDSGTPITFYTQGQSDSTLKPQSTSSVGNNQPVSVIQPYVALTYIIAIQGIFPPRN